MKFKDLEQIPFVLLSQHMQLREYVENLFNKHEMNIDPAVEVDSAHMIMPMVKNNFGVGIVPLSLAKSWIDNDDVFVINLDKPLPNRKVFALINKFYPQSTLLKEFISKMKQK